MKNLLFSVLIFLSGLSQAQPTDTLSVLFVGNSYTYFNNLPHIVSALSDSTDTKLITEKSVIGGAWLHQHWRGLRELKSKEMIENGSYDVIILQENSLGAINAPDSTIKYMKKFRDLAKSKGAQPYIFLVWAREKVPQYHAELEEIYNQISRENDIPIIPIGDAWKLARSYRPDGTLFHSDGTHPSNMGTFLTAAVIVGQLTGEIPEKFTNVPTLIDGNRETVELMRLDWLDVIFLLKVAQEHKSSVSK